MSRNDINPGEFHHTYEESVYTQNNPEVLEYDDTFDRMERSAWGGRPWVKAQGGQQRDPRPLLEERSGLTILTYNVFADCKCQSVRFSTSKKWDTRSRTLIREIASYNADILCLQDVDHFGDFWRPQLMLIGYDSVYKKRTTKRDSHYEGVCVAYKRNAFQLFRSVAVELNKTISINTSEMGSAFKDRLVTDDVALICMLQPWKAMKAKKPPKEWKNKFSKVKVVANPAAVLALALKEKKEREVLAATLAEESAAAAALAAAAPALQETAELEAETAVKEEAAAAIAEADAIEAVSAAVAAVAEAKEAVAGAASIAAMRARASKSAAEASLRSTATAATRARAETLAEASETAAQEEVAAVAVEEGKIKELEEAKAHKGEMYRTHNRSKEETIAKAKLSKAAAEHTVATAAAAIAAEEEAVAAEAAIELPAPSIPEEQSLVGADSLDDFTGFDDEDASDSEGSSHYDSDEFDTKVMSAVCVVSAQLSDRPQDTSVRYFQAQYLMREVETANKEFHLPIVLGVSLFDSPISSAYHVFKTGRSPIKPQAPRKITTVQGVATCRGSTKLCWRPPKVTKEDPPILKYRIAWRPGGNLTMGFRLQTEVDPVICLAYGEKLDKYGVRKTYQKEDLEYTITGLTSDMPFEFIVCAVNEISEGIWSDPSMPVVMPNPERAPAMPALKVFNDPSSVTELRERSTMQAEDWDVEVAISSNPINSRTQLTPRLISGRKDQEVSSKRILPISINPREGWKKAMGGGYTENVLDTMMDPKILNKSIIRRREEDVDPGSFLPEVTDTPRSKRALVPGLSTKAYLLVEDPQNEITRGLWDDRTIATNAPDVPSVNFLGTFSKRRLNETLDLMIEKEKFLQRPDFDAREAAIAASRVAVVEQEDEWAQEEYSKEGSNDAGNISIPDLPPAPAPMSPIQSSQSKTNTKFPIVGDTESKPYIETKLTETLTAAGITSSGENGTGVDTEGVNDGDDSPGAMPALAGAAGAALALSRQTRDRNQNSTGHDMRLTLLKMHTSSQIQMPSGVDGDGSLESDPTTLEDSTIIASAATNDTEELAAQQRWVDWQDDIVKKEEEKLENMRLANLEGLRDVSRTVSKLNDATFLDGSDLFQNIGLPHARTLHTATMRSAYEQYGAAGEPLYTQSFPAEDGEVGVACTDYIFCSADTMCSLDVLGIPELPSLHGENPREILAAMDPLYAQPNAACTGMYGRDKDFEPKGGYGLKTVSGSVVQNAKKVIMEKLKESYLAFEDTHVNDKEKRKDALWAGMWSPFVTRNEHRDMHWLPNETFASSHLAMAAKLTFVKGHLVTNWR